jgi:hypothetical protein
MNAFITLSSTKFDPVTLTKLVDVSACLEEILQTAVSRFMPLILASSVRTAVVCFSDTSEEAIQIAV